MRSIERAWRCLSRKRGKTVLLGSVLFLAGTLILGMTVVADAAAQAASALAAQTQAKLVCEGTSTVSPLTLQDAEQIAALDGVSSVNRHLEATVSPDGFAPVTQSTSDAVENLRLSLLGYDDLTQDGPFADGSYTLTAGSLSLTDEDVLMSEVLAAENELAPGDTITLSDVAGRQFTLRIAGLFHSGNEEAQDADTLALARLENQLFTPADVVTACGEGQMDTLSVYVNTPEMLEPLAAQVRSLLGTRAEVTGADGLYQRLAAPLTQLGNMMQLMRAIVAVAAAAIVTFLIGLWLRGRQQEMAVYLSIGMTGRAFLAQVLLECAITGLAASLFAIACAALVARFWGARLAQMLGLSLTLQVHAEAMGLLLTGEVVVVVFAVLSAMLPLFLHPPKTLVSRMEE